MRDTEQWPNGHSVEIPRAIVKLEVRGGKLIVHTDERVYEVSFDGDEQFVIKQIGEK